MARRLILDTGVLIAVERGGRSAGQVIQADDDVVIAAVTVAELLTGVELADDDCDARAAFVSRIVATIPVEPYDVAVAQHHARLPAAIRRTGTARGAHDLVVAATVVSTNRSIVTTDTRARFSDLPEVPAVIAI